MFVGRTAELDALNSAFASSSEVVLHAVHGLGGVGKSALAQRWAADREELVRWWINADSPAEIDAGLAALARALQPGLSQVPTETQTERALAWLATRGEWLLVLDNVEDPAHIRPLMDRIAGRGRVIVTTRRATGWYQHAVTVRLGTLKRADSVALFTRILTHNGPRTTDGVDEVCAVLGDLALAVEQAGSFCAESGTDPHTYLQLLADRPEDVYAARAEGFDPARTMDRIWRVTLDRLAETPLAGTLLRILAWYAPDNIPRDLLTPVADPLDLAATLGRLTAYSMITDNHDGTLSVHRLVQDLARTPHNDDPHRQAEDIECARDHATELLAVGYPDDSTHPDTWAQYQDLAPHTDALISRHTSCQDTFPTALILDRAGSFQLLQGSIALALSAFQRALATCERVLGPEHPATLASRNNLAGAYESAGDLGRAVPLYESALADRVRVLGPDHPDTLTACNNLAGAYQSAGEEGRALPLYERTLADCVRVLGPDHPDTLISRNNLAYAYESAGDLGRALPLYERTLADRVRVLGPDHPYTLTSRNNLAGAYESAGDSGRALPLYERTLADRVRVLGPDHPDTLTSRNNLACAYQSAGDSGRAVPLFESALADRVRVLGPDHPDTLASRNNLAGAYQSAGEEGRALPLYESALADCVRVLGPDHPDTLASRNNLAGAYQSAGEEGRALPLYESALADCVRVLGPDHPDTLASRNNLAGAYQSAGDLGRAVPLFESALADRVRVLGPDHPATLASRNNLACAYQAAGDLGRAVPLYESALADRVRVLGPDHPATLASRNNLACAYQAAGDLGRAVPL
ncbi:tetratricopeptide repeat protein, partial [Streptomyces sp. SID11385]|nr:tetratricopeptide repeat protein [Streptomyces sp. SID11385]